MTIIEKLGIEPIKECSMYTTFGHDNGEWVEETKVRKLENQRNDLLEALIWTAKQIEDEEFMRPPKIINPIERATNRSWEQIKELIK